MSESIITRRGGGSKAAEHFATISVLYPAGATLTCSKDAEILTASDTTGYNIFVIPSAGTWTIAITDGTNSKSTTVSITKIGQYESVELLFRKNLYTAGDQNVCNTLAWKSASNAGGAKAPDVTYNNDSMVLTLGTSGGWGGIAYFPEKVDLTNYSTLLSPAAVLGGSINKWQLVEGLYVWSELGAGAFGTDYIARSCFGEGETTKNLSVDVSSLSGEYYIGFGLRYETSQKSLTIKEVYLE